jgi:hypothetical protein
MQRARGLLLAFTIALPLAIATGCRSGNPYEMGTQNAPVTLVVNNQNFNDVDVYAVGDGLPTRVGTVTGNTQASFALNQSFIGATDFRVVATPIGGNGRASTGQINISPGQTVYFTVAPVLRQSSVSIR